MASGRQLTWEVIHELGASGDASVPLDRVLRQREAAVTLGGHALRLPSLGDFLDEAARIAEGADTPMAKILEHRPAEREMLVRAGWGLKPGIVGRSRVKIDASHPAGECFQRTMPVFVSDVSERGDYHLPPIYAEHGVVASLNVPIIGKDGRYGVLEVDCRERRDFDALDLSFLAAVASFVAEGVDRLREKQALEAERDAKEVLMREHHHRVRNNYQTIAALAAAHARRASSKDSRQRFQDVERRVFALASLYDHLLGTPEQRAAGRLDLGDYLDSLCSGIRDFYSLGERSIELACRRDGPREVDLDVATTLGTAVNELIANSVEHAFDAGGGRIAMCLERQDDGRMAVVVEDDGAGFAPPAGSEGIGLDVVRRMLDRIGASMEATPNQPRGTTWTIRLGPAEE